MTPGAHVLIITEIGKEEYVAEDLAKIKGVKSVTVLKNSVYSIQANVETDTDAEFRESMSCIRRFDGVRSDLPLRKDKEYRRKGNKVLAKTF
jgi:hypothetical protein